MLLMLLYEFTNIYFIVIYFYRSNKASLYTYALPAEAENIFTVASTSWI